MIMYIITYFISFYISIYNQMMDFLGQNMQLIVKIIPLKSY